MFIFKPLVRQVVALARENLENLQTLQQKVALRTEHLQFANEKLLHLATHDPLTGLNNRLNLEEDLDRLIEQFHKKATPFAVLMMDIDWFKKVNDDYGHHAGDFILKELADLLTGAVRNQDCVYRAGGEEFVILFSQMTLDDAITKAEMIRVKFEQHEFNFEGNILKITVSLGLFYSDFTQVIDVKTTLKSVDNALYRSKRLGRNCVSMVGKYNSSEESL